MNTEYEHNALKNKYKLLGMHDIHQTLRQFLNINKGLYYENEHRLNIHNVRSLRGVSLLEEIPINRSCYDVLIPFGQCYCGKTEKLSEHEFYKYSKMSLEELKAILLDIVVQLTTPYRHQCVLYEFKNILSIVRKQFNTDYIYTFEYLLEPGNAVFIASIVLNKDSNGLKYKIIGKIIRTSRYNDQSYCITNSYLKNFCYCINQPNQPIIKVTKIR